MSLINFLIFPAVGAAIGALTNQVAIKMLFRPYRPVRIGQWQLPFTPGVIPSNRRQIARNIAETFEAKLLSGGEIHAVITGARTRRAVIRKISEMFDVLGPLAAMLDPLTPKIANKIIEAVEEMANEAVAHGGELDIGRKIEEKINAMDIVQLEELVLGVSRRQFRHITLFGGVLGALIGLAQALINLFL